MSDAPVIFDVIATKSGKSIGVATLNAEKTLNSLSLPMIDLLTEQFTAWHDDDNIAMILFQGAGDRAFSAGGDIQDLYKSMCEHPGGPNPYADQFFEREYRLDHLIRTYPKPILVWANGFVMGGGLGVMAASSHRIGTQGSRIAMPEITIGLFPDAGATWFLAHMPTHLAYFLAWTGSHINAIDARRVGFVDHLVAFERKDELTEKLKAADWSSEARRNHAIVDDIVAKFDGADFDTFPASVIAQHEDAVRQSIDQCLSAEKPAVAFDEQLERLDLEDKWLGKAAATFRAGCPVTAHVIHEQIQRAQGMSLRETFMLELTIAIQCSRHPDFAEGIRALLIDRDNHPNWHFKDFSSVTDEWIEAHFSLPFAENPLSDLA